jgi:hypothetical protein
MGADPSISLSGLRAIPLAFRTTERGFLTAIPRKGQDLPLGLLNGWNPDQPDFAGQRRIYRSQGRVARTRADFLSIHNFKIP